MLLTENPTSQYQLHHPDRLGTRLVTNASDGTIISEQTHLPYGAAMNSESSGTATNRRFTSYDRSTTTKLDYAVNRFYNAGLGRFTQVDPIGMGASSSGDPQSLNLYAYCGNDPINHTDPDGLFFKKLFSALGKAFKFIFKVAAIALIVAAIILLPAVAAGGRRVHVGERCAFRLGDVVGDGLTGGNRRSRGLAQREAGADLPDKKGASDAVTRAR